MSERRFQKLLKAAYILVAVLLVVVITLSFLLSYSQNPGNLCTTKTCIGSAHMILQNLDTSVDPCEDFYQFSCGSFLKNKHIPDDQVALEIFDMLKKDLSLHVGELLASPITELDTESTANAKKLFTSCMDEDYTEKYGEQHVLDFINSELGGWPILQENFNPNLISAIDKLVVLRLLNVRTMFDIYSTSDPQKPTRSILRIRQPPMLFSKDTYNNPVIMNAYRNLTIRAIQLMNQGNKRWNQVQDIERMLDLEKQFELNQLDEAYRRNKTHQNLTIRELQRRLPDFNWKYYIINGLFRNVDDVRIDENEVIIVDDWEYLVQTTRLFSNSVRNNRRDLDNLLTWKLMKVFINYLPKAYKEVLVDFNKINKGVKSMELPSKMCSNAVIESMEYAVGRMYVQKFFDSKSKDAATDMILNIRSEFRRILKEVDWMDDSSRSKALAKVDMIDIKIGYPDFLFNKTALDDIYKDFIFSTSDYFGNSIIMRRAIAIYGFKELREPRDRTKWISGPAVVNAFYSPPANQICFPAGILQSPFYDSQNPNYLNYGGIGTVIGHEITHGFDDKGRLYDKDGVYFADGTENLWSESTVRNYKKKAKCIEEQYSNYVVDQVNKSINGLQTLGENIADNGGLKESYRAYQRWARRNGPEPLLPGLTEFNQNQLFFINYAQVWCGKSRDQFLMKRLESGHHSPGEFRIIGPTSNLEEFADAFSCKRGQKNNPAHKCAVW